MRGRQTDCSFTLVLLFCCFFCFSCSVIDQQQKTWQTDESRQTEGRFQETTLEMREWSIDTYLFITSLPAHVPSLLLFLFFMSRGDDGDDGATRADFSTLVRWSQRGNMLSSCAVYFLESDKNVLFGLRFGCAILQLCSVSSVMTFAL